MLLWQLVSKVSVTLVVTFLSKPLSEHKLNLVVCEQDDVTN